MNPCVNLLKLENFRSIDTLELRNIGPFSVFAGANGSGKSNFFDALDFAHRILRFGAEDALRAHGGVDNVRCYRRQTDVDGFKLTFSRGPDSTPETLRLNYRTPAQAPHQAADNTREMAALFRHLNLYRIHPEYAKQPSLSNQDPSQLNPSGGNLAAVLYRLEKDPEIRETIIEWLQLVVPTLQEVQTETERLTGSKVIAFVEEGLQRPFPPHLISDGTVYLLCLLVAVLDRGDKPCLTLIEEPERGLHPKAIQELVQLFRAHATPTQPVWMTTHSESVVRCLHPEELWLVDKADGATRMKQVHFDGSLPLDQAWLSNALSGGLPW